MVPARNCPCESGSSKIRGFLGAPGFPAVEIRTWIYFEPLFPVASKFTSTWQEMQYALELAALKPWDIPTGRHVFIFQVLIRRTRLRLSLFWSCTGGRTSPSSAGPEHPNFPAPDLFKESYQLLIERLANLHLFKLTKYLSGYQKYQSSTSSAQKLKNIRKIISCPIPAESG